MPRPSINRRKPSSPVQMEGMFTQLSLQTPGKNLYNQAKIKYF
jgi:hypothetical protein